MTRIARWLCLILLITGTSVGAATWYVDSAAKGAKTGTSWADAWNDSTNIAWSSVSPGDTVFISGGLYSPLNVGKSGTANNPITISIAHDAGHNTPALIRGLSVGNNKWITIRGGLNTSFLDPSNVLQVNSITNNIGFWLTSTNGTALYMTSPVGIDVSYVGITNVTRGSQVLAFGIWANMTQGGLTDSNRFLYCYIDTIEDDGVNWIGNDLATHYGHQEIGFSVIKNVGDDGFEANNGWTIHDSVIGPSRALHGHPDGIQSLGSYWKIYNNIFYDFLNSAMRIQMVETNSRNILIYNNLINIGKQFWTNAPNENAGIEIAQYANNLGEVPLQVWTNIVVANNTLYTTNAVMNGGAISWSKRDESFSNSFVHNVILTNSMFVNNLFYRRNSQVQNQVNGGISWQTFRTNVPWGNMPTYTNESANLCDYNTCTGTFAGDKRMSYFGIIYTNGETMALSSIYTHNKSTVPSFVAEGDNFELADNDTSATGNGMNLNAIFNYDILNRPRNPSGAWDRGAFSSQSVRTLGSTLGLQVWLTFDDDFSDSKLDDASGNGNHAWRFGRIGSTYPTNFPKQILSSTTPGRTNLSATDSCGRFDWYATGYGIYGREGDYAGITNVANLTNMAQATFMCWARYYAPHAGTDYSSDANETLLSSGTSTGVVGTWGFGRFNEKIYLNNTRFYVLTNGSSFTYSMLEFPENGYKGDSTNWAHYAVTWNNGVMIGYLNGRPFQTNDISATTTRLQIGKNPNNPTSWIGVGCNTHGGTPPLADESPNIEYPNHGWLNGVMDDVRIYNRALSASEIQGIYAPGSQQKPVGPGRLRIQ